MIKRQHPTGKAPVNAIFLTLIWAFSGLPCLQSQTYTANGSAAFLGNNCYQLTPGLANQAGSIFTNNTISLNQAYNLTARLNFGCKNNTGADGIAFILAADKTQVGPTGGGLGYQGITPSLVVQMDDFQNGNDGDPGEDHIAILKNGSTNHTSPDNLAGPVNLPNLEDCKDHCFTLNWNPATQTLTASLDGVSVTYTGDIVNNIFSGNPNVYAGFSSGTGTLFNPHTVCFGPPQLQPMDDVEVCPGDSLVLQADTNGIHYAWDFSPVLSNFNTANPTAYGVFTTLLFVDITYTCGYVINDAVVVTVLPLPGVWVNSNSPVCEGKELKLMAGGVDGFNWTGPNGFTSIDQNPVIPNVTQANAGTYNVSMNSQNGCKGYLTLNVAIKPASQTSETIVICESEMADVFGVQMNTPGVYTKNFPAGAGNCDSTHTITLIVNDTIQTSETIVICENEMADVFGNMTNAAGTYPKSFQSVAGCDSTHIIHLIVHDTFLLEESFSICGGDSALIFGVFEKTAGVYQQNLTTVNGCDSIHIVTLLVSEALDVQLASSPPCAGLQTGEIAAMVTGGLSGYQYQWNVSSSGTNTLTGLAPGDYSLTVTDAAGCTATASSQLAALPDFDFEISTSNPGCFGETNGSVSINTTAQNLDYSLDGNNFQTAPTFSNLPAGSFTLYVRDANGCQKKEDFTLTQAEEIFLQLPDDVTIESGDTLAIESFTDLDNLQFHWSPDSTLSCGDCPSPVARPETTTLYTLTVTDSNGCEAIDSILVTVELILEVHVPNVFTPNNDGTNDRFYIIGKGISEVRQMRIYDRWGRQVYEAASLPANDKNTGWDGTEKGRPVNSDVFVYQALVRFVDGSEKVVKGDLTLVR